MEGLPKIVSRILQLVARSIQWVSAAVVMGISSFFISKTPRHQHVVYQEVIAVVSVVVFLPGFVAPFITTFFRRYAAAVDSIFSYLWLTSFIFAAQDYNSHDCSTSAPPSVSCTTKRANEAFMFIAFFFTFVLTLLEGSPFHTLHRPNKAPLAHEKVHEGHPIGSGGHNGTGNESTTV